MTAAAHRNEQIVLSGEVHRCYYVRSSRTASDQRGMSVDHPVPNGSCLVVTGIFRLQELAAELLPQGFDLLRIKNGQWELATGFATLCLLVPLLLRKSCRNEGIVKLFGDRRPKAEMRTPPR